MQMRAMRMMDHQVAEEQMQELVSGYTWVPLGPAPLASDASGVGQQDYDWVSGRATAVAVDPADASGNTVYVGGAYGGVWKSTNAGPLSQNESSVVWTPMTDNQATLSVGSIAIQPGNGNPANSLVLVGTGEPDSSYDSYYGLGILRSADAGKNWTLISADTTGTHPFAGIGFSKIAFSSANPSLAVAAAAGAAKGNLEGLNTTPHLGLYYSSNAGTSWTYASVKDGNVTLPPGSATSVRFNAAAGAFFAVMRYHGVYSSVDGVNWSRLAVQPGSGLNANACPAVPTLSTCPIYRGEMAVVPGRNEMYTWYVDIGSNDQGIWRSTNGGASWTSVNESGISNCGDSEGCGTEHGVYNLELAALPNGEESTDLYAGAVNLYKCTLVNANATSCLQPSWLNLTHAYGCPPNFGSIAHVHPGQHDLDFAISNGKSILFFANDGGLYRALDGYTGLTTGTCGDSNQFDSLNQTLGSLTQLVSFSQSPNDLNLLLAGAQDNGSPATSSSQTSPAWLNVNSGDGGYNEINPTDTNEWFTANTGVSIQKCGLGADCHAQDFANGLIVSEATVGGDIGPFYTQYILDPQNPDELLVGTCRVWRGSTTGSAFDALSYNFDTGTASSCSGYESNLVRSIAAGGARDVNSFSNVIYAGTDLQLVPNTPFGGHLWVTTNAAGGPTTWVDRTGGINPGLFPISGIVIDTSDAIGNTAYLTIMGFHVSHVWKTTNAGQTWTDFTANLPDSPANAIVVDPVARMVYVATDIGVFFSSTDEPNWTELGPDPGSQAGYLPNTSVTALRIFSSGGIKRLRASTYGRGMWEVNLIVTPDYFFNIPNPAQTIFPGQTATFAGTLTAVNGFNAMVTLSCASGAPSPCTPNPTNVLPTSKGAAFVVTAASPIGDYPFNIHGAGWDKEITTHDVPVTLHVVDFGITDPSPGSVTVPHATTSTPITFQVTASGSFAGTVTLSCSNLPVDASCAFSPSSAVNPRNGAPVNASVRVTAPYSTALGTYTVVISASTPGAPAAQTQPFSLTVAANPDFLFSAPVFPSNAKAGNIVTGTVSVDSMDAFSGTVSLSCTFNGGKVCSISPAKVSEFPTTASLTLDATSLPAGTDYLLTISGVSGSKNHVLSIPFTISDYAVQATTPAPVAQGNSVSATITLSPLASYVGSVVLGCDPSDIPGATCGIKPSSPVSVGPNQATVMVTVAIPDDAASGTHTIYVNTHDAEGAPGHQATVPITVKPDFDITSSTGPQTINAGQSATYTLHIDPLGPSFDDPVTLTCSGSPDPSSCSLNPATVTPGRGAKSVLTVITIGPVKASRQASHSLWATCLALPGLIGVVGFLRKRPHHRMILLAVLCLGMIELSCGGGGGDSSPSPGGGNGGIGTPRGTYTIVVSGTSGSLVHTAEVTLTIQ
jgi:hypothetical protein